MDKAGNGYWASLWKVGSMPKTIEREDTALNNYINRRFHDYFCKVFQGWDTKGKKLLEVDCARFAWLPYFARVFGFHVSGIDYSEIGCKQAEAVVSKEGV